MNIKSILINISCILTGFVIAHSLWFLYNPQISKFYNTKLLVEQIINLNKKTGINYEYTYNDIIGTHPLYKINIGNNGRLLVLGSNGEWLTIESDLEVLLLAIENIPHFSLEYLNFVLEKQEVNNKAIELLLKELYGKIETEFSNKTDK